MWRIVAWMVVLHADTKVHRCRDLEHCRHCRRSHVKHVEMRNQRRRKNMETCTTKVRLDVEEGVHTKKLD